MYRPTVSFKITPVEKLLVALATNSLYFFWAEILIMSAIDQSTCSAEITGKENTSSIKVALLFF